jgi:hypothetical protein
METASRTLVKSRPEVWEQLDQPERMQGLMSALLGRAAEVQVYEREEESTLAWKAVPDDAWIKVEIGEKGWGTKVSVSAEYASEPTRLEGWLGAVLDELATPQKRPFESMSEAREPNVRKPVVALATEPPERAPASEPEPTREPGPGEEPEPAGEPAIEGPAKPKRIRRFFFGA